MTHTPVEPITRCSRPAGHPGRATSCRTRSPRCSRGCSAPAVRRWGCCLPTPRHGAGGGVEAQPPPGGQRRHQGHERAQPGAHGEADQQVAAGGGPDHRPPAATTSREARPGAPVGGGAGRRPGRTRRGGCRADPGWDQPAGPFRWMPSRSPLPAQPPAPSSAGGRSARRSSHRAGRSGRLGRARGACQSSRPPPAGRSALSTRPRSGPRRRRRRVPPTPPRPPRRARPTS
jgi:hypothetical protein